MGKVWSKGLRLESRDRVSDFGALGQSLGDRVWGLGLRVRVQGAELRV